ncbi:ATP-grasp domain-containing protein [Mucilaginibacter sp. HMF5004]|uniref:ATP-grasp domain-containing protein n=1 Tax=Mucilaginibacter rivuli TaxID=2857527 RepID=UPI001C5F968B|nr:ATP-grasp domain-containing protein [Mucilaginibacter rivuli]MBW4888433.1 ATP-grasp domain-containing protein [Mucilaginibacter rivuli]
MYKVLLVSIASFFDSTGEIPFMFKRAGCQVDVFCDKASWLLSNKYYDNWIESVDDHETFKNDLVALIEKDPGYYDWVVLLEDIVVKLLNDSISSEWMFKKLLPITKIENRELLSSKMGLSNVCNKYGIATPRFINYSEEHDIGYIQQQLHFPILLKEDFSFSGIGVHYCEEPALFEECLSKVRVKENLVLQEFIKGEDVGLEALFKDGELITYNCAEVLTYMYNRFSFTTRRRYYQNDEITALLKTLGKSIGLNSFASIQYIYHPERQMYYLIELDARTNAWMPYSRFTENDFSDGIKRIMEGNISFMPSKTTSSKRVEVLIFDRDIRRCIKHRDIKGLLKWVFNYNGYWKFIPFYDGKIFKRVTKKIVHDFTAKFRKSAA